MLFEGLLWRWDVEIFLWINSLAGTWPALDNVIEWLVSDYLIPVSVALSLVGLWFAGKETSIRYKYQIAVFIALATMAVASWAVQEISVATERSSPFLDHEVNLLFYRPTDFSFPSNSVAAVFGIAAGVFGGNRKLGVSMFILGAILGFSRVYAGVHYPIDVITGALLGIVIATLMYQFRKLIEPIPTWFMMRHR